MKALVLESPRKLIYKEIAQPKPQKGEVLLQVKAASICGSDVLRVFHNAAKTYPLVLGHECAGVITEVGEGVSEKYVGQRAALAPLVPCLECSACKREIYSACKKYSFIGSRVNGAFAEYVVAPQQNIVLLPDEMDFKIGAILEPSTVAVHALRRADFRESQNIAVVGVGSIGLCTIQWGHILGAKLNIAIDVSQENLEIASALGATHIVNSKSMDPISFIKELTDGDGVDIALEMAGLPQTLDQAVRMVKPRGAVVCLGNLQEDANIPSSIIEHIIRQELSMFGTFMSYSAPFPGIEWVKSVEALQTGELKMDSMISHEYPLAEGVAVMEKFIDPSFDHRKVILKP